MTQSARPIILASRSRIRAEILARAGIAVQTRPAEIDETSVQKEAARTGMAPEALALRLAEAKARAVAGDDPVALVIGVDQVLSLDGEIFAKPTSLEAARAQLQRLRGRTHRLDTAFACLAGDRTVAREVHGADLTMRDFSDAFLDLYLDRAGPGILDSVGGYQLEGLGAQLFERVAGDYFAILGLPLLPLLAVLRAEGGLPA